MQPVQTRLLHSSFPERIRQFCNLCKTLANALRALASAPLRSAPSPRNPVSFLK